MSPHESPRPNGDGRATPPHLRRRKGGLLPQAQDQYVEDYPSPILDKLVSQMRNQRSWVLGDPNLETDPTVPTWNIADLSPQKSDVLKSESPSIKMNNNGAALPSASPDADIKVDLEAPRTDRPTPNKSVVASDESVAASSERALSSAGVLSWSFSEPQGHEIDDKDEYGQVFQWYIPQDVVGEHVAYECLPWVRNVLNGPSLSLKELEEAVGQINDKGIHPLTGQLLSAVEQPQTYRTMSEGQRLTSQDVGWRHDNMTSNLAIAKALGRVEKAEKAARLEATIHSQSHMSMPEESAWPSAACRIRPVQLRDFAHIAEIMNLEAQSKPIPQVIKGKDIVAHDIQKIFAACQRDWRPFIVAESKEDDLDAQVPAQVKSSQAFQEFLAFKAAKGPVEKTILGFAYIQSPRQGFLGTGCRGSRFSGLVRLVVHPAHRKKGYGTALLDRVMQCVSSSFSSVIDYTWENDSPGKIYDFPVSRNQQQYARLYFEVFTRADAADAADARGPSHMLRSFEFEKVARFKEAVKTDEYFESQCLDLNIWELPLQPMADMLSPPQHS